MARRQKSYAPSEMFWPISVARNGKPFHHLEGVPFGRLTAISVGQPSNQGKTRWVCRCSCGGSTLTTAYELISGHTRSCGCENVERATAWGRANRTHGHARHGNRSPEYLTWQAMHQRCYKPKTRSFEYYGGRGIAVCERWKSFENFLADMGERPADKTLDRIDSNSHYEPQNCRWATGSEQRLNQRGHP
jgi:hypothetical protein